MLYVILIVCVLGFFWFVEIRIQKEVKMFNEKLKILESKVNFIKNTQRREFDKHFLREINQKASNENNSNK